MKEESPNNKKGQLMNQGVVLQIDDDLKKALVKEDNITEVNEPTKYILLNDALVKSVDDERVKHFTKYQNLDEVLQMNDIEKHADLIPLVFGSLRGLPTKQQRTYRLEYLEKIRKLFLTHAHDHMDNMMSLDTKGGNTAKLLVLALKQDNNPLPADKEVKRMFGGK
jgi:uncharacterized protein YnzC (UPF0291/DUF896 family)